VEQYGLSLCGTTTNQHHQNTLILNDQIRERMSAYNYSLSLQGFYKDIQYLNADITIKKPGETGQFRLCEHRWLLSWKGETVCRLIARLRG
jgi:hypothetical protein